MLIVDYDDNEIHSYTLPTLVQGIYKNRVAVRRSPTSIVSLSNSLRLAAPLHPGLCCYLATWSSRESSTART